MIIVRVELHSARTGQVSELGMMAISNQGSKLDDKRADYLVEVLRKGANRIQRTGEVKNFPRKSYSIWRLVLRALKSAFPEET